MIHLIVHNKLRGMLVVNLASYPGLPEGGERKAWYILFAHARNRPDIPQHLDSIVTRPWHNDVTKC